jgi:hypothetical protein
MICPTTLIDAPIKYAPSKAREKKRAVEAMDDMVGVLRGAL